MARKIKCEICGADFECGGLPLGRLCWCSKVSVTEQHRAELALLAHDCVCPNCLKGEGDG